MAASILIACDFCGANASPADRKFGPIGIGQRSVDVPKRGSCLDNSAPRNCPRKDSRHATAETHLPNPTRLTLLCLIVGDRADSLSHGSRDDLHTPGRLGVRL